MNTVSFSIALLNILLYLSLNREIGCLQMAFKLNQSILAFPVQQAGEIQFPDHWLFLTKKSRIRINEHNDDFRSNIYSVLLIILLVT